MFSPFSSVEQIFDLVQIIKSEDFAAFLVQAVGEKTWIDRIAMQPQESD